MFHPKPKTSINEHEENDRDSVSEEEFVYFLVVKALFAGSSRDILLCSLKNWYLTSLMKIAQKSDFEADAI